jgi:hypothetical protein
VSSPILDTVPSKFSEDAIEKKIDEILEKKLSNHLPDNVPSIEVVKDRLDNWVLAVDGDIKDINQKIRDRSLQVDHQIAAIKSRLEILEPLLKLHREASIASPIPTGEPSPDEPNEIETAIEDTLGTGSETEIVSLSPSAKRKGLTDSELARHLRIDKSNITRWKQKGHPTPKYQNQWELRGRFWYEID